MSRIIYCITLVVWLSACISSSIETPGGSLKSSTMFGIVSTSRVNTVEAFDRCRELLKPGHIGEPPMIDRSVFSTCYAVAMAGIDPRGQQPPPMPQDLNGDGRPDVARYQSGLQVPYGLYAMYPGVYWPQMYGYYGYGGVGGMGMMGGVPGNPYPPRIAPPGRLVGQHTGYGTPENAAAPQDYVTREQLRGVVSPLYDQTDRNAAGLRVLDKRTRGSR
jgi:hypothetical protein